MWQAYWPELVHQLPQDSIYHQLRRKFVKILLLKLWACIRRKPMAENLAASVVGFCGCYVFTKNLTLKWPRPKLLVIICWCLRQVRAGIPAFVRKTVELWRKRTQPNHVGWPGVIMNGFAPSDMGRASFWKHFPNSKRTDF